jgi:alpha/beta superfamily hydrolase
MPLQTDECPQPSRYSFELSAFRIERDDEPFSRVTLSTNRGQIRCRYYPALANKSAILFAGGAIPGFHEPANHLYSRIATDLAKEGIASLHVSYRFSTILEEATLDLLAGCVFLRTQGIDQFAVVGYSFGGAVALEAAIACDRITRLITLATQSCGRRSPQQLNPHCSLLLIHGAADRSIPHRTSEFIYSAARDPKQLHIIEGASHDLTECSDQVFVLIRSSLLEPKTTPSSPPCTSDRTAHPSWSDK